MATFDRATRKQLAAKGEARPDGSYPIRDAHDLVDAVDDYNRSGQDAGVAAWIAKRARELQLPNPLKG